MTWYLRSFSALVFIAFGSGCASSGGWSPVEEDKRSAEVGAFRLQLPAGWMQLGNKDTGGIVLSRDGANLQRIELLSTKGEAAFPKLKRGVQSGVLVSELAGLQLAEMRANPGTENLEVVRNEPATIAGRSGYMLHVRFKNARGLRYDRVVLGFTEADTYYTLTYQAPTLHYFARDRAEFDTLVRSIQPSGKAASS